MNYTADSTILRTPQSPPAATAAQIDALFAQVAKERSQGVTTPPVGLGQTFINWSQAYRGVTVDVNVMAAQSAHETAGWTSYWASLNNPAGIGVTGEPGKGNVFGSVGDGIEAQVCHLLDYAVGTGQWSSHDPRYSAMPKSSLGSAPTLVGLNGKWATPGDGYGGAIAALANRLLTMEGGMVAEIPGFAWVPDTKEYGYPALTRGRNGRTIDRFIQHCTIGTDSLGSLLGQNNNSVHLLDNRDGTPRAQMVALADAAWGCGNREYNLRGVNYEHECTGAEMLNPAYWTDALLANMAKTVAAVIRLCPNILPDREHIIGHGDVPDQDHTDPGPVFPWDRYIAAIQHELGGQAAPQPDKLVIPGTAGGFGFVLGFKGWVESVAHARSADVNAGALSVIGYPLEDEWAGTDGLTYQRCERGTLQYNGANQPPFDIVVLPCRVVLPDKAA